jgi:hypothetical protein
VHRRDISSLSQVDWKSESLPFVLTRLDHLHSTQVSPCNHFYKLLLLPPNKAKISFKMVAFLVDLEFREKARQYLTSKEILFVVFFLCFALLPWIDIFNGMYSSFGGNATAFWEDFNQVHCNPKFAKLCPAKT